MKRTLLLTILSFLTLTFCSAQSKKEAKQRAKLEAQMAKAEAELAKAEADLQQQMADKAAQMEADGWKVMKSNEALLELMQKQHAMELEKIISEQGVPSPRYVIQTAEAQAPVFNTALRECQTVARREILVQLGTQIETATTVNTKTTSQNGEVETKTSTGNYINEHVQADASKAKELMRLSRRTEKGYEVKLVMYLDLEKNEE